MRSPDELLKEIGAMNAGSNAPTFEKAKAELDLLCATNVVNSINDLNSSIKQNSISNESISKKLFWLNIALIAATAVGAVATIIIACLTYRC